MQLTLFPCPEKEERSYPASFRMRIAAVTEAEAAAFTLRILPLCLTTKKKPLVPLLLAREPYEGYDHFEPVGSWSWADAAAQVARIAAEGFNAIVLSDFFLNWRSEREACNDELEAFSKALAEHKVCIFDIESFSPDTFQSLTRHIKEATCWPEVSIEEVLSVMLTDYEEGPLIAPWGGVPYLLLYPQGAGRMAAGFQIQQYDAAVAHWPEPDSPWGHLHEIRNGVKCARSGPIAMRVV